MANTRRIGFRGDTRHPNDIFRDGFLSRLPAHPITYHPDESYTNKKTAVCFTWRLSASAYFPVDQPEEKETWIYVLNIDLLRASSDDIFHSRLNNIKNGDEKISNENTSDFANIHGAQYLDMAKKGASPEINRLLFADEMAVKEIKSDDILFAVKCRRSFNNPGCLEDGGIYQLIGPIIDNPNFKPGVLSPEMIMKARELIEIEIQLSKKGIINLPSVDSGVERNPLFSGENKQNPKSLSEATEEVAFVFNGSAFFEKQSIEKSRQEKPTQESIENAFAFLQKNRAFFEEVFNEPERFSEWRASDTLSTGLEDLIESLQNDNLDSLFMKPILSHLKNNNNEEVIGLLTKSKTLCSILEKSIGYDFQIRRWYSDHPDAEKGLRHSL
ncbi:MAG TPA: hypothetical protein VLI69_00480 [Gammaproteobacteria bacterium]|nr:hypothetical protein [Gammaproteobacteria bacterium]